MCEAVAPIGYDRMYMDSVLNIEIHWFNGTSAFLRRCLPQMGPSTPYRSKKIPVQLDNDKRKQTTRSSIESSQRDVDYDIGEKICMYVHEREYVSRCKDS